MLTDEWANADRTRIDISHPTDSIASSCPVSFALYVCLVACATRYEAQVRSCRTGDHCGDLATWRGHTCIANGSLIEGDTCSDDVQCSGGLTCPLSFFTCANRAR